MVEQKEYTMSETVSVKTLAAIRKKTYEGNERGEMTERSDEFRVTSNLQRATCHSNRLDHHPRNLLILVAMKDRVDRGGPESGRFSVAEKSEFQASATK
jgi:hypothetical protein